MTVDTRGDAVFDVLEGAGASISISIVGPESAPATDGLVLHEILAEVGVENDPGEVDISADATSTLSNPLGAAPAVLNFAFEFDALARAFGELPEGSAAVDVGFFEENIGTPLTSSAPLVALFEPGESFADDGGLLLQPNAGRRRDAPPVHQHRAFRGGQRGRAGRQLRLGLRPADARLDRRRRGRGDPAACRRLASVERPGRPRRRRSAARLRRACPTASAPRVFIGNQREKA
ncbi:MAG: hypothetical protein AAF192_08005 [Pseudomonadota bacterium]